MYHSIAEKPQPYFEPQKKQKAQKNAPKGFCSFCGKEHTNYIPSDLPSIKKYR